MHPHVQRLAREIGSAVHHRDGGKVAAEHGYAGRCAASGVLTWKPRLRATSATARPCSRTRRTASALNSGSNFPRFIATRSFGGSYYAPKRAPRTGELQSVGSRPRRSAARSPFPAGTREQLRPTRHSVILRMPSRFRPQRRRCRRWNCPQLGLAPVKARKGHADPSADVAQSVRA